MKFIKNNKSICIHLSKMQNEGRSDKIKHLSRLKTEAVLKR